MFKSFFILTVFCLVQVFEVYSQTPSYYHYTSSDGLASSTVYQIIQARDGFTWFGTSNGISKFDGQHFTTYRTKDGLNSNSIISLTEGNAGEIYIGNYEKGINVIRNGLIENYCSTINGKSFALSYLLLTPSKNGGQKLYAYRNWGYINVIHEKKTDSLSDYSISLNPQHITKLEKLSNNDIIVLTTTGLYNFNNERLTKLNINDFPDTTAYCLTEGDEGCYFVGTKGIIYKIKNECVIKKYKIDLFGESNDVTAILKDKNNNLWFSIMNKGFFLIQAGSDKIIDIGTKMNLQNTLVNNYLEDNEGNIWVSTFGKGTYCLNNLYLKSFNENDGLSNNNVYSIAKEKSGKLLIGTFNGINILENWKFGQVKSNSGKTLTENIYSIVNYNNDFYICGTFDGSKVIDTSYKGIKLHMMVPASFCKTSEGAYLFGQWDNSITIQKKIKSEKEGFIRLNILGDNSKINRVNQIFEDTEKNIWIGTGLGLCKVSNFSIKSPKTEWKKTLFPSNPVLNSKIKSIFQDSNNKVWIASDKGIASYNLKDDSVKTITSINGYDLSSSTSVVSDKKNRIWIGNMKGLFLLDGNSIKILNMQTGLPSDEILSLFIDKEENLLYIGTSNGISILDISLFDKYVFPSPEVKILSVMAGDSVYTSYNKLVFKPKQNHVYIDYKAISFSSPGSVKYKYRLNGEWAEIGSDFLDFNSLEKGKYDLQIMAKSLNSEWGKPSNLSFEVNPRFTETILYKLGIISIVIIISIAFVRWYLNQKNKKNKEELELTEKINELKHQALSAMMNPHFIFNSLNSVQYLINCNRNEEAINYIAMMAKLMRKNLDTAGNGFILLYEEIERLTLYLDLEKLRFQDSFSYEINIGADVDINTIMIPNMIIQPFVENTLWHGITNSDDKSRIIIQFTFEDIEVDSILNRSLIVKIADNGIGIKEAKKHKKVDHVSKGIQIVEERLRLLSNKMHLPQPIMLEDLSGRDGKSHGTEVIISLPPPLYQIIILQSGSTPSITV